MGQRITKRMVDGLKARESEFTVWDDAVTGFGLRVRPSGAMSYVVVYRAGPGRGAPVRRYTIAAIGKITPEDARACAKAVLGSVAHGCDPARQKTTERASPSVAELADRFMAEHINPKFAERAGIVADGLNPARKIDKFKEGSRERFLTGEELERLGAAIVEAESTGIPWAVDETKPTAKHLPDPRKRFTKINQFAAAALRLLMFTGCRLREILHLRWEHVDLERGLLFLPDSKTGKKTMILNAPAIDILNQLEQIGPYVVPGDDPEKPRPDLHRPWRAITKRAGLEGVRLHDLRHTYASFGAGDGLGLPIIGRLLGHAQASTTARYAHLDNDPLRRASEAIGGRIAAALNGKKKAPVISIRHSA